MKAKLLVEERIGYTDGAFLKMVVWEVPQPVPPSQHLYKYSFAYIEAGERVIGYDNERGESERSGDGRGAAAGDHRHIGDAEEAVAFVSISDLIRRFMTDVEAWRENRGGRR